ncbi:MAG: TonB-dependent receptor plug domain-containing protein [Verrucomicrobiota bacterium]|nr:TonB-dependent receptor plug domain-containing protein [Verrucomicrobiota bacterium]
MTHSLAKKIRRGVLFAPLVGVGLGLSSMAYAQTESTEPIVELEKTVVTGSLIPSAGETTLAPVTFIDTTAIRNTGVATSVLEIIRKSAPQFVGNGNLGASNGNVASGSTGGGSFVALRNTSTLVLINGRRAAISPIAGSGGFNGVDLNQIPVSAVERIDILNDGASAIYGADATAGVVNIILKTKYQGGEVGTRYGVSDNEGSWEERSAYTTFGASNGKTSVTISAEWNKQDPLFQAERSFSNPAYGTPSFAGVINIGSNYYVLKPGLNAPPVNSDKPIGDLVTEGVYVGPFTQTDIAFNEGAATGYGFNLAQYVTVLLSKERRGGTINLEHKISDYATVFGDILYSRNQTLSQINAQPLGTNAFFNAPASHPYNPTNVTVRVRNRFVTNPRQYFYDSTSLRALGGLKGDITDKISYEVAGNWNEVNQSYKNRNVYDLTALMDSAGLSTTADPAGPNDRPLINFFAREQAPGAVNASGSVGTASSDFTSRLTTFDAVVRGSAFEIPMGDIQFAVGAEHRRELLIGTADLNSIPDSDGVIKWVGATSVQPIKAKREIASFFGELNIPLLGPDQDIPAFYKLNLDLQARHEKFSDTSDPTVKKIGLRWEVLKDELVVRSAWGESFNAPDLYSMYGPTDQGFTDPIVLTPKGASDGVEIGQAQQEGGANPLLQPAESTSYGFGFVYTPKFAKGLSLEVNYFNIKEDNIVGGIPSETILQDVEDNGAASPYAKFVAFNNFAGRPGATPVTAAGQISTDGAADIENVYVTVNSQNLSSQELDGFDFVVKYANKYDFGKIDFASTWTYFTNYDIQILPTGAPEETAGRASNLNGTIPRWRVYNTLTYGISGFDFTVGHTYIPSMPYENAPVGVEMDSYQTFDASVSYAFGEEVSMLNGLTLRVGVNNIGNVMPPLAPELYDQSNADIDTYDPIGRLFYIEASYKF